MDEVLKILHSKETTARAKALLEAERDSRKAIIEREQKKLDRYEEKRQENARYGNERRDIIKEGRLFRAQFEGRESERIIKEQTEKIKRINEAISRL